jgi:hypothetical protein
LAAEKVLPRTGKSVAGFSPAEAFDPAKVISKFPFPSAVTAKALD